MNKPPPLMAGSISPRGAGLKPLAVLRSEIRDAEGRKAWTAACRERAARRIQNARREAVQEQLRLLRLSAPPRPRQAIEASDYIGNPW